MPELPEVETVRRTLKKQILNEVFKEIYVYYPNIIAEPNVDNFTNKLKGQKIIDMTRRGKWLIFVLNDYLLLTHLRMEGKFFLRKHGDILSKHEHVAFLFESGIELRYNDTRKFGKMYLLAKDEAFNLKPLNELGKEPWDDSLTIAYLKEKYMKTKLPIKTVLLDQSIITGIGNIYADEILFLSHIDPLKQARDISDSECEQIILNTQKTLSKAIELGGTTIRSYESSEGVHGRFQNNLFVHNQEGKDCPICGSIIAKMRVGGRGTYYCPNCQKSNENSKK